MKKEIIRIGEDNICPLTKQNCDDETCTPGAECNISGDMSGICGDDIQSELKASRIKNKSYDRYLQGPLSGEDIETLGNVLPND